MDQIIFLSPLPWWAVLGIGLGILALLLFQLRSLRERLTTAKSWILVVLRGVVYGVLLFFLLSPGLIVQQTTRLRRSLTVVVDVSQSMSLPAGADTAQGPGSRPTRIDLVKEKLLGGKEPLLHRLARDYELRLYQFGDELETVTPRSISELKAQGSGTRLWDAVREAGRRSGPNSAIVLFSDGITDGEPTRAAETPSLPVPVFAVGVGETRGYTDLRITEVNVPDFAFRGREFKFDFSVQAHGLAGKTVPLYFNRGKNLILSRREKLDPEPDDHDRPGFI
ncbi:MAG: VWA domain-containing protein [Deltaproteobacteria bacterium]|nr:VWA domain-containing protein [Deltaproteobacteria bacterium]